tara:strand:- start:816 stop:1253 length:438 start_codon:yes stop_codon:yes gene_type:complete
VPVIKNKSIQPAGSFNYAEGIKVYNGTADDFSTNQIVQINGVVGGVGSVRLADSVSADGVRGRVLVLKHDLPAGRYGVALPWKIVEGVDTSRGGGGAVGDLWFIGQNADKGNLVDTAVGVGRPQARTIKVDATNGAYLVDCITPF